MLVNGVAVSFRPDTLLAFLSRFTVGTFVLRGKLPVHVALARALEVVRKLLCPIERTFLRCFWHFKHGNIFLF